MTVNEVANEIVIAENYTNEVANKITLQMREIIVQLCCYHAVSGGSPRSPR